MPAKVYSAAIVGLDAKIIEVESKVVFGLRSFKIVGLPDKAVEESKERVGAALSASGYQSPHSQPQKVLVNLAPADLKKEGSLYDLPIALSYLIASNQIKINPQDKLFLGELSLDGMLRPIRGGLAFASQARKSRFEEIILPLDNALEASLIKGVKVKGAQNLNQIIDYLLGKTGLPSPALTKEQLFSKISYPIELEWIKGQNLAKRALEIAAAGAHNLMMMGPPGAGKTLLAQAMSSILPRLSLKEAIQVTKIYSIAGLLSKEKGLIETRPFRAPHHASSEVALIGGGNPPRPGEITLAHRGILFLDEFPEFHRDVLESLRQPLEEGRITILRSKTRASFPARFTLIGATNPCPCGYFRDPEKKCRCTNSQIRKYQRKLSGPLMDRMDLFVQVPRLSYRELIEDASVSSLKTRKRVEEARETQRKRFRAEKTLTNSEMNIPQLKKYCSIENRSQGLLKKCIDSGKLSARGYHRVLKVSRTIADLEKREKISFNDVGESLMYRIREED